MRFAVLLLAIGCASRGVSVGETDVSVAAPEQSTPTRGTTRINARTVTCEGAIWTFAADASPDVASGSTTTHPCASEPELTFRLQVWDTAGRWLPCVVWGDELSAWIDDAWEAW